MRRAWLAVVLCAGVSCSSSDYDPNIDRERPGTVLFESYSVDLTWGYKLTGIYIEADGSVWEYESAGTPWYPEKLKSGELTATDMLTKHRNARQVGWVDREQLRDMAGLIGAAARGSVAADPGWGELGGSLDVAYKFDRGSSIYREVVLSGNGSRVATNSSPEAQVLLDYLRDVAQDVRN